MAEASNPLVVAVVNGKGGVGKTTFTINLAGAAQHAGEGPTGLINGDVQQSLEKWWSSRQEEMPLYSDFAPDPADGKKANADAGRLTREKLNGAILAQGKHGCRYVFIDSPPALQERTRLIIEAADLVVVPILPAILDVWEVKPTTDIITGAMKPLMFVLNRVKPRASITHQIDTALRGNGHRVATAFVPDLTEVNTAIHFNQTCQELNSKGKSAIAFREVWSEVRAAMKVRRKVTA